MRTKIKKYIYLAISIVFLGFTVGSGINGYVTAQDIPIDLDEVLTDMDAKLNFGPHSDDMTSEMSIVHKEADGTKTVSTSVMYSKETRDRFMVIFTSPISDVGSGYLKVERNLWYYDSQSREWIKKTFSEKYHGTDVETQDLESNKYKPFFDWEYADEDVLGKVECYVLWGTAKYDDMHYPNEKIWIRKDNYLPLKEEAYTASGTLARTAYMLHYVKLYNEVDDEYTYVDDKRLIVDNIDKSQSLMERTNISLQELPVNMFTKSYFEQKVGG